MSKTENVGLHRDKTVAPRTAESRVLKSKTHDKTSTTPVVLSCCKKKKRSRDPFQSTELAAQTTNNTVLSQQRQLEVNVDWQVLCHPIRKLNRVTWHVISQ